MRRGRRRRDEGVLGVEGVLPGLPFGVCEDAVEHDHLRDVAAQVARGPKRVAADARLSGRVGRRVARHGAQVGPVAVERGLTGPIDAQLGQHRARAPALPGGNPAHVLVEPQRRVAGVLQGGVAHAQAEAVVAHKRAGVVVVGQPDDHQDRHVLVGGDNVCSRRQDLAAAAKAQHRASVHGGINPLRLAGGSRLECIVAAAAGVRPGTHQAVGILRHAGIGPQP